MTLREFLEQRWAARRGRPIDEALSDFGVPVDGMDGISRVGAERIRDREIRWAERGLAGPVSPSVFVDDMVEHEDFMGALWLDGFVAGMALQRDWQRANRPGVLDAPVEATHVCHSCGKTITYGEHAEGCEGEGHGSEVE